VGRGVTETGLAFTREDREALTPGGVSQRFDRLSHGTRSCRSACTTCAM